MRRSRAPWLLASPSPSTQPWERRQRRRSTREELELFTLQVEPENQLPPELEMSPERSKPARSLYVCPDGELARAIGPPSSTQYDYSWEPPCSFLSAGQAFEGTQNVSQSVHNAAYREEEWKVNVRLQGCDPQQGYVCGSMEALNVPSAKSSVVTFWEGEIVDNVHYTFYTAAAWGADRVTDLKHWSKFKCFAALKDAVVSHDAQRLDLQNFPYVFMRWKEKCFINVGPDCGLTIAGFYYVCFSKLDGSVEGFYYDPNSSPFQRLQLKATCEGRLGQSFASYDFR